MLRQLWRTRRLLAHRNPGGRRSNPCPPKACRVAHQDNKHSMSKTTSMAMLKGPKRSNIASMLSLASVWSKGLRSSLLCMLCLPVRRRDCVGRFPTCMPVRSKSCKSCCQPTCPQQPCACTCPQQPLHRRGKGSKHALGACAPTTWHTQLHPARSTRPFLGPRRADSRREVPARSIAWCR